MKKIKIILLLLLIGISPQLMAQKEVKKPAEVFELFFKTFLNNDESAQAQLNDYLKPTVEGQITYPDSFKDSSESMVKNSVDLFLSKFSKAAASACKKEAENYFRMMFGNFRNGKLTIKNVKIVPNEYNENQKIAEINYVVSFKIPSNLVKEPKEKPGKLKPEELKKYLIQLNEDLKNADKTVSFDQSFSLYENKVGDKIYYLNGSPDEIVTNLTDLYFNSIQ